jgi:hypothetical protein
MKTVQPKIASTTVDQSKESNTPQVSRPTHFHPEATRKGVWIRLNHKGIYHDNRRLLKHRAKNCECFVCYREMFKLPPAETNDDYLCGLKTKVKERENKRVKRIAKKEVKAGKQTTINSFFQSE